MQSYSQIREFIEENDVEFIRLAYFDGRVYKAGIF